MYVWSYEHRGPALQGVKAVIATSYERIHRSNLVGIATHIACMIMIVGMGIIPLQFRAGESADSLGLTGKEQFTINITSLQLKPGMDVPVTVCWDYVGVSEPCRPLLVRASWPNCALILLWSWSITATVASFTSSFASSLQRSKVMVGKFKTQ